MHVIAAWSLHQNPSAITKEDVNWNEKSHIKMLKTRLFNRAINAKNVAVLTADRAFALFFCPHPGGCDSSRVPTPGNWLMHNSFLNNGSVDFRGIDSILKDGPISFCTVKDFSAGCLCFCWWISVYSLLFPANEPFCWLRCSCSFDFSFSYPARKTRQD